MKSAYITAERVLRECVRSGLIKMKKSALATVSAMFEEAFVDKEPDARPYMVPETVIATDSRYTMLSWENREFLLPKYDLDDYYNKRPAPDIQGYVSLARNHHPDATACLRCKVYGYYTPSGRSISVVADVEGLPFRPMSIKLSGGKYKVWINTSSLLK